ncbi:hypothetical protein [uncultured Sphingobacterium sp.]|jgi:hypothetical protein|uniref:hypothetical protein n=1 Tax=uncultured Sphingobacterium sp. TaxID=182688 RepID=UPI0037495F6D
MIQKKETIATLSKKLSLPYTGTEQGWDIEMADSNCINEFIDWYHQYDLRFEEKVALMYLIIASYDDFLNANNVEIDYRWDIIKAMLAKDRIHFVELINYWSLRIQTDIFRITPLMRTV